MYGVVNRSLCSERSVLILILVFCLWLYTNVKRQSTEAIFHGNILRMDLKKKTVEKVFER